MGIAQEKPRTKEAELPILLTGKAPLCPDANLRKLNLNRN